jgi:type I restriction enzyme R subunit
MNLDNFVVRPQRKSVEKFAKREAWSKQDVDSFTELE